MKYISEKYLEEIGEYYVPTTMDLVISKDEFQNEQWLFITHGKNRWWNVKGIIEVTNPENLKKKGGTSTAALTSSLFRMKDLVRHPNAVRGQVDRTRLTRLFGMHNAEVRTLTNFRGFKQYPNKAEIEINMRFTPMGDIGMITFKRLK